MNLKVKAHVGLIILLFSGNLVFCQVSNIILFTENGERFSIVLNGVLQNSTPETNVKITDLPAPSYKLKVIFEDQKIPAIDKTLMMGKDLEMTYCIKKNRNGEYVVRFMNQVDLIQAPPSPPSQHVFVYSTVPPPTPAVIHTETNVTNINNVNAPGGNVSITINTGSTNATIVPSDHYIMPGYSGPIGCPYPLTDLDFQDVKKVISEKSFEDSKLKIAKQVTSSNCLFSSEVKQIMELFSFEDSKLEYAKYAYRYTYDIGNYYKVNDAFKFESSIDELNKFIHGGSDD